MEKFCPTCGRIYAEDATVCEADGEILVVFQEEPDLIGEVLDDKYTIISKLGEGGMGTVYLGKQATIGRDVAVKVLRSEFSKNKTAIARFLREARAASRLSHPNTITVYDFGQSSEGLLYLVMERLIGAPLDVLLEEERRLDFERARHIMVQICDSLSEAHAEGITHRDLKPENIWITKMAGNHEFVKVLDFGIAKIQDDDVSKATATGMICGTPSYMSPEQTMGKALDGRSDIYSLGILLYEMLVGDLPYLGDSTMEIMLQHINGEIPSVSKIPGVSVPPGFDDVLKRFLAKNIEDRPANCQEAKRLLLGLRAQSTLEVEGITQSAMTPMSTPGDVAFVAAPVDGSRHEGIASSAGKAGQSGARPSSPPPDTGTAHVLPELKAPVKMAKKAKKAKKLQKGQKKKALWPVLLLVAALLVGILLPSLLGSKDGAKAELAGAKALPEAAHDKGGKVAQAGQLLRLKDEQKEAKGEDPVASRTKDEASLDQNVLGLEEAAEGEKLADKEGTVLEAGLLPEEEEISPEDKERDEAEAEIELSFVLNSEPTGASVYEGDQVLGKTPLTLKRAKGSPTLQLVLKEPGFQNESLSLLTEEDFEGSIVLKKVPVKQAAPPRPPKLHEEKPPQKANTSPKGGANTSTQDKGKAASPAAPKEEAAKKDKKEKPASDKPFTLPSGGTDGYGTF